MAYFYNIFEFLAVNTFESNDSESFDILSFLPLEMAISILRLLPPESLVNAASVSRRWWTVCKSDRQLRKRIRRHLRKLRKQRLATIMSDGFGRTVIGRPQDRHPMTNFANAASNFNSRIIETSTRRPTVRFAPYHSDRTRKTNVPRARSGFNLRM